MTERLRPDARGLERAAEALRAGDCVAFPTETVYGLGADGTSDRAVAGIYAAKGRPQFNPLILHVADLAAAEALIDLPAPGRRLAERFWPGPLTLVAPVRQGAVVSLLARAGLPTLAVRVPAHPVAQALLSAVGFPLAAPSANPSGRVSPTTADHVMAGLDGRIAAVLDGGPCGLGVESTIVGFLPEPVLLRPGGLPVEEIAAVLGQPLGTASPDAGPAPVAPGQLASHYAPRGRLRLNAESAEPGEVMLGFGPLAGDLTLSASGDLAEAAANLFSCLHRLDAMGATQIAVAPVPNWGLGLAINDRLRRAAAPRD